MGENSAEKDHMSIPMPPIICASQVIAKLGVFCVSLFMSGCAMVIGHGNAVGELGVTKNDATLPEL